MILVNHCHAVTLLVLLSGSSSSQQSHLMELARKQRMNTDVRKSVFCLIMSSEVITQSYSNDNSEHTDVITVGLH